MARTDKKFYSIRDASSTCGPSGVGSRPIRRQEPLLLSVKSSRTSDCGLDPVCRSDELIGHRHRKVLSGLRPRLIDKRVNLITTSAGIAIVEAAERVLKQGAPLLEVGARHRIDQIQDHFRRAENRGNAEKHIVLREKVIVVSGGVKEPSAAVWIIKTYSYPEAGIRAYSWRQGIRWDGDLNRIFLANDES